MSFHKGLLNFQKNLINVYQSGLIIAFVLIILIATFEHLFCLSLCPTLHILYVSCS